MRPMPQDDPVLALVPERLATDHLLLDMPRIGDGAVLNLAVVRALPHLKPWMAWAQQAPTVEQSEAIARRMQAQFLLREHLAYYLFDYAEDSPRGLHGARGRLIGGAGLHRIDWLMRRFEIGYWLAPDATGRGLASEAVRALARMAFERLRARRLEIRTDAFNFASRAVAERCGFMLEGVLRQEQLGVDGVPRDTCIYGCIDLQDLRV